MKNLNKLVLCVLLLCAIVACSSVDSVKVGGGYETEDGTKVDGSIEIILKKIEAKAPVAKN
jgi:hypothetical protein